MVPDFDEVLARAQRGDGPAFAVLYEDLVRPVAAYLRSHGAPDVDDLVSDVFLGVFTGIGRFRGRQADFRSFVFSVAHRRLVDGWRRAGTRGHAVPYEVELDSRTADSAEAVALSSLGQERLQRMLERLSDDQRTVLLLRVVADLSIEQTAEAIGKAPGAVKQLQRRGLIALRAALEAEGVTR